MTTTITESIQSDAHQRRPKFVQRDERPDRRDVLGTTVQPSIPKPGGPRFTLDQELEPFCRWTSDSHWIPPKNASREMAQWMLQTQSIRTPAGKRWSAVKRQFRTQFTEVREIELDKASIRLPKGRLLVSVTRSNAFDTITDRVPACVQTRLDEFMAGPGRRDDVRVFYLKPLCVEVNDQLIFTSHGDMRAAESLVQQEVQQHFRRMWLRSVPRRTAIAMAGMVTAIPVSVGRSVLRRRRQAMEAYHAQLELKRRKTALRAMRIHQRLRTHGCSYDDMLELTNPLITEDVVEQFGIEQELSQARRKQLIALAAGQLPWFMALTTGIGAMATFALSMTLTPSVGVCDPVFVAQMPNSGTLLKIGHFDEIAGVTHVEI